MRLSIPVLLGMMAVTIIARSSNCPPPTLQQELAQTPKAKDKIKLLNQVAWDCRTTVIDTAIKLSSQALLLSRDANDLEGEVNSLRQLGLFHKRKGHFHIALDHYKAAIALCQQLDDAALLAKLYHNNASALHRVGQYENSYRQFLESIQIKKQLNDEKGLASSYIGLGNVYTDRGEYEKALTYYKDAYTIYKDGDQPDNLAIVIGNIATVYHYQEKFDLAIDFYRESLAIRQQTQNKAGIAYDHSAIASVYTDWGKRDSAINNFIRSLELYREINDPHEEARVLNNIGEMYEDGDELDKASIYYLKALDKATTTSAILHLRDINHNLSALYDKLGNYRDALLYHKAYMKMHDSIIANQNDYSLLELKTRYETARVESALMAETNRSQQLMYLLVIVILLLAALVVGVLYVLEKRAKKMQSVILDRVEKDREEIGQELHDQVNSKLANVFQIVESASKAITDSNEAVVVQLSKASLLLQDSTQMVRKFSHRLNASSLKDFGLQAALIDDKDYWEATGDLEVEISTHGPIDAMPEPVQKDIYFIIQEAMTNVSKYAQASKASIAINRRNDLVNVMITDNGVGFDNSQPKGKRAIGFKNMEVRAGRHRGKFQVDTAPGKGVTIIVDIPM